MISSLKTSFTSDDIDSSNAISNAWNKLFIEVRQNNESVKTLFGVVLIFFDYNKLH